jgi:Transposase
MLADELDYVVGVDTHLDEHVLAVVAAAAGAALARQLGSAKERGYQAPLRFAGEAADGARAWAVEGTGSYGAGLARYLAGRGETVLEVSRTARTERRLRGKDDALDGARTARAALASETLALPRNGKRREALRLLLVARRSAVDVRREALGQLRGVSVTAPDRLREELRVLPTGRCSSAVAALAARARREPTSSLHGSSCAASLAESTQQPARRASSNGRSSLMYVHSRRRCSTSGASAQSFDETRCARGPTRASQSRLRLRAYRNGLAPAPERHPLPLPDLTPPWRPKDRDAVLRATRLTDKNVKGAAGAGDDDFGRWIGHGGCRQGLRSAPVASVSRRSAVFGRARPFAAHSGRGGGWCRRTQRALRLVVGTGDPGPKSGASGMEAPPRRIAA